jgi:Haem-binding domain
MKKKIGLGLLAVLVVIQFIRPTRNVSSAESANEISKYYAVPADIHAVLKKSCYDCHSNNTAYPWYTNIQPVGWWLQDHVNEGKGELNFDEFGTYEQKKAKHKFEEIEEVVNEGEMPLESYTLIHRDTKLTPEQSAAIASWAAALK